MNIIEFLSKYRALIFLIIVIVIAVFRKRIKGFFKRKKKVIDYSSRMDNGLSFEETFDFSKTSAEDKDKYEKKLKEIDEEITKVKSEMETIDTDYNKRRIMLVHKEKQLGLQYNVYVANLKNLDKMVADQKQMEEELGK